MVSAQTIMEGPRMTTLRNAVCLVTGGASGIGRAIALAWAREGAKVVVSDLEAAAVGGAETVAQVRAAGAEAVFVAADVARDADCAALVARTLERYGRLDAACNNAGVGGTIAPTADYALDEWHRVLSVNLTGVFLCMKHEIPALLASGGGAIVNVASILGAVGFAGAPAYTAAKHGVLGLTKVAALDYAARGVRVNAIGPAFIHTPMIAALEGDPATLQAIVAMHPAGRLGGPEEVAELVAWLSSARASFVNGAYWPVDGGFLAR
jgi:NAD(P)-dependent dehydrogenase (short-subunit alcohol dehydrogenase family)